MKQQDKIISFYKFTPIQSPLDLKKIILEKANEFNIKGTILIAQEGVNGMISGVPKSITLLQDFINTLPEIAPIEFKSSYYDDVSFRRMLVKVKKEIITMRRDVDPLQETGKSLDPKDFKKWMNEKKDIHILDTRNDYEVSMGTFDNAINPNIKSFEEFALYVDSHAQTLKEKPVVTFCTGGIRCEKATSYMIKKGIKNVYQLKGGILKYFEEASESSDTNWKGECIVFDKRKAITPELKPSQKMICYICLTEMNQESRASSEGPGGAQCKKCHEKKIQCRAQRIARKLSKKTSQQN